MSDCNGINFVNGVAFEYIFPFILIWNTLDQVYTVTTDTTSATIAKGMVSLNISTVHFKAVEWMMWKPLIT